MLLKFSILAYEGIVLINSKLCLDKQLLCVRNVKGFFTNVRKVLQ